LICRSWKVNYDFGIFQKKKKKKNNSKANTNDALLPTSNVNIPNFEKPKKKKFFGKIEIDEIN
jgi:hypothetical protein